MDDRYAVIIGISNYKDKSLSLKYGSKDASDINTVLIKSGRFLENNIKLLTDSLATRENIRKSIEGWLQSNAQKDNLVFIFYSGHGTQRQDNDGDEDDGMDEYLVPFDYDDSDISSGICDDIFASWIRNLKSANVFIMFDCCFSGGAAKQKGFSPPGSKGIIVKDDFLKDVSKEIPRDGVALMAACKSNQVSFENDELKNGVFAHYAIEAINNSSDLDLNNIIDEQELFSHCQSKVRSFTKEKCSREQEPMLICQLSTHLNLFYLPIRKSLNANADSAKFINYQLGQLKRQDNSLIEFELRESLYKFDQQDLNNINRLAELSFIYDKLDNALYFYKMINAQNDKNSYGTKIAEIYSLQGDFKRVLEWTQKISDKTNEVLNLKVEAMLGLHDTTRALALLTASAVENPYQKFSYMKMFHIYIAQSAYTQAQRILKRCQAINPHDLEPLYWTGMLEKHINRNSAVGDSILKKFYDDEDLKNDLRSLEGGMYGSFASKYPYLKEGHKKMVIWASQTGKQNLRKKHLELYKFYGKLDLDKEFVHQQEN